MDNKSALDIKKLEKGICFICSQPCNQLGYVHLQCAYAYWEMKQGRMTNVKEGEEKEK